MTKVKICGITNLPDATAAIEAGADYIGFVLSESPRRITLPDLATMLIKIDNQIATVGVFATVDDLAKFRSTIGITLDYYQIYFPNIDHTARLPVRGWIHAHFPNGSKFEPTLPNGDLFLIDCKYSPADADAMLQSHPRESLQYSGFIAGGLGVDNVSDIVRKYQPYGVDVARGVESRPGVKDHVLMREFVKRVREKSG